MFQTTNQRLWSGTLNSRAMRFWVSQAGSNGRAFKRVTSSPVKPQKVSSKVSSWQAQSSCNTRSLPSSASTYHVPGSRVEMLHCPWLFDPQATAQPSLLRSTVWSSLAETWVYDGICHLVRQGWNVALNLKISTTDLSLPITLRSTVCTSWPAKTWVYVILSGKGGMSHCPFPTLPQATATPSLLRRTVWCVPAETIGRKEVRFGTRITNLKGRMIEPKWLENSTFRVQDGDPKIAKRLNYDV